MTTIHTLLTLRRHIVALIGVLDDIEQTQTPTATPEMTRQEIIDEIALYGIDVNQYNIDGLEIDQLLLILEAIQVLGNRFLELAGTCGLSDNELTAKELTDKILKQPINLRYNRKSNQQSTVDEKSDPGTQILTFDLSVFYAPKQDDHGNTITDVQLLDRYSDEVSRRIIIHEFGHLFHNLMNETINEGTMTYTRTVDGQQRTLKILPDTPEGIVGYIETVGAFYYTNERDFDYPPKVAQYSEPLTTLNFRGGNSRIDEYYNDNQLKDTIKRQVETSGASILIADGVEYVYVDRNGSPTANPILFVEASTYVADYSDIEKTLNTVNSIKWRGTYFPNETRDIDPSPKEGFADTFAMYVLDPKLLENTTRGQVMDEYVRNKICKLLTGT